MSREEELEQESEYFERARSWADERDMAERRSVRVAWIVATAASALALLEGIALVLAVPLKTAVPLAVLVDRTTGYVERIDLEEGRRIEADEALQQAMLAQYVLAREGYNPISIANSYEKVLTLSSGQARASYLASMKQDSPRQRLADNGRSIGFEATIKSITSMGHGSAMVRFDVSRIGFDGARRDPRPYVATIGFGLRTGPMSYEDRLSNPLGFEVRTYRVSPEALPEVQAAATAVVESPVP